MLTSHGAPWGMSCAKTCWNEPHLKRMELPCLESGHGWDRRTGDKHFSVFTYYVFILPVVTKWMSRCFQKRVWPSLARLTSPEGGHVGYTRRMNSRVSSWWGCDNPALVAVQSTVVEGRAGTNSTAGRKTVTRSDADVLVSKFLTCNYF